MKNLFLLMSLLNIMLFAWQYTRPHPQDVSEVAIDPGVDQLILLSELEVVPPSVLKSEKEQEIAHKAEHDGVGDAIEVDEVDDSRIPEIEAVEKESLAVMEEQDLSVGIGKVDVVTDNVIHCFRMGAFNSPEKVELVENILAQAEIKSTTESQVTTEQRYWVMLPTQPGLIKAKEIVQKLKDAGVKDLQILTMAGKKNAISLGLYKVKAIAEVRVKEIKKLGYKPRMDIIPRTRSVYWLDYQLIGDKSLSDKVIEEISRIQEAPTEERDCK